MVKHQSLKFDTWNYSLDNTCGRRWYMWFN